MMPNAPLPILHATNLSKAYGGMTAVSNINLALPKGRIIGLLGPNGSGKTTLIKLAAGLLTPTTGSILIDGLPPGPATKAYVSYLPDRVYVDGWMKVRDCLAMFADFYADFDRAKAAEMLRMMGIDGSLAFKTLSKGTQEKVQLSLTMSRAARLYLLDEPIGGVDPASRDFILSTIINNYNEDGTVIISTHLIYDIERVLDDVIFLVNGQVERATSVDGIREQSGKSVDEVFREVFRCWAG
jgi:ABC-2 type transport system ATP-binding protein